MIIDGNGNMFEERRKKSRRQLERRTSNESGIIEDKRKGDRRKTERRKENNKK